MTDDKTALPERELENLAGTEAEILAGLEAHAIGLSGCGRCPYKQLGAMSCREQLCRDAAELIRALEG